MFNQFGFQSITKKIHTTYGKTALGTVLNLFSHFTEQGRSLFDQEDGKSALLSFCHDLKSYDRRSERLLGRACSIVSLCSPGVSLPLEDHESPIKFELPREGGEHCFQREL